MTYFHRIFRTIDGVLDMAWHWMAHFYVRYPFYADHLVLEAVNGIA